LRTTLEVPDVIVDTSVVQYLHQAGLLDLLRALYGTVIVPAAVAVELAHGRDLGFDLPDVTALDWMQVQATPPSKVHPVTRHLGAGELDAIGIALERPGALVVLDDRLAREYAARLGVRFTGTLGVLLRAKIDGHLPVLRPVLDQLDALGFRVAPTTRNAVLEQAGETE
jgi:predicted nucleic acid-binding protein